MKREEDAYHSFFRKISPQTGLSNALSSEISIPRNYKNGKRARNGKDTRGSSAYWLQFSSVLWILRLFGRYSLQRTDKGKWESKVVSWWTLYCLVNYAAQTYVAVIVCFRRIQALVDSQSNYDEFIFSIHILAYLNIHFHVPFSYWLQGCRMAHYLNLWANFQTNWEITFGQKLELVYRKAVIVYICIVIPAVILFLLFEQYSTLHDPFLYFLPYFFTIVSTALVLAMWYFTCLELKRLSADISERLIVSLEGPRPSGWLLRRWRLLWLDLWQLTESLSSDLSAVLMSIVATFSTTFLLGLYNGLSNLLTFNISWKAVGYLCASTSSLSIVFAICDAGHRATAGIATCTLAALLKSKVSMVSSDVRHEIFLILESIKAQPSDIKLGGFVTLNRTLIVSLISNTLTYLIVLLQFKVNEEDNKV